MVTASENRPTPPPDAVAEIERHMQWPVLAILAFLGFMAAFLALALFSLRPLPPPLTGLPDDPDARAAAVLLAGRVQVATGGLRLHAAVLGGEAGALEPAPADTALLDAAARRLALARVRRKNDPRLSAALGAVALARGRLAEAERLYLPVTTHTRNYGEVHLGYAVALALRAEHGVDELHARTLRLQAIAQCAAVRSDDPAYPAAEHDRAVLLARVGREEDARLHARRYLERVPSGEWSDRLRALLQLGGEP